MDKYFVREKKIKCGKEYMEVDIIPRTDFAERAVRGHREKKQLLSRPTQINLNDKNSKRYAVQLANGNFGLGDYSLTCTYNNKFLPTTLKDAEREIRNCLRRLATRMKKVGLELKYILVTEFEENEDGTVKTRVHHHLIINGGLSRDEIEEVWSKKLKGEKKQSMGFVNVDRLQPNENGLEGLVKYMNKKPVGKKRWSSSRNLKRPEMTPNDYKYKPKDLEKMAMSNDTGEEYFSKKYPNYFISSIKAKYNEDTGWHFYLRMWKKLKDRKKKRTLNYGQK